MIWLRARPAALAGRVGPGPGARSWATDPAAALGRLEAERRPLYAELADAVVDVDDLGPAEVAELVLAAAGRWTDEHRHRGWTSAARSYDVVVGQGVRRELAAIVATLGARQAAVVTQDE